MTHLNQGST